jgi:hypothetical protein
MLGPSGKNGKYIYSSLGSTDWARFVEILPGKPEDEISCRISHAERSPCPDYEALSRGATITLLMRSRVMDRVHVLQEILGPLSIA